MADDVRFVVLRNWCRREGLRAFSLVKLDTNLRDAGLGIKKAKGLGDGRRKASHKTVDFSAQE